MRISLTALLLLALVFVPAFAGNGAPSGPHFNLNIIGVEKGKTAPMTNSDRHTIFVGLGGQNTTVTTNIYLVPSADFEVCDGNGFDAAINCEGTPIKNYVGAVFALPCNTNLPDGTIELVACNSTTAPTVPTLSYEVWARALGKPNGSATVTTCATDNITQEIVCSSENVLLLRNPGKSTFKNVTNELTSLVADIDADGQLERVALFQDPFEDWFWQYANKGLRLAQLRFYVLGN